MKPHPQAANAPLLMVGCKPARDVVTITSPKQLTELYGWLPKEAEAFFARLDMRPPMIVRVTKYGVLTQGEPIRLTDEQIAEWRRDERNRQREAKREETVRMLRQPISDGATRSIAERLRDEARLWRKDGCRE